MSPPKSGALCAFALLLLLAVPAPAAAAAAPETPDATFAASASAAGALADGTGVVEYTPVEISEDGRYVAFQSASQNLGPAGPPGAVEGFVKDLETGAVELVSRADGVEGEPAAAPGITTLELSGDGRYVLFTSAATNLGPALPGEEVGETHVYRRDLATGQTTLVDRVSGVGGATLARGAEGDSISADGGVVAFTDRVANLEDPAGDHSETPEPVAYVRDLGTGMTTAIGRADGAAGELADRGAELISLSPDGRFATFMSAADNLGSGIENYFPYLRDIEADTTTLLARNALGEDADAAAYGGDLSGGAGCYGVIESNASNLLAPARTGIEGEQTYVFDRCAGPGAIRMTSVQEDGSPFVFSVGGYAAPAVTADGEAAVFAGSTNGSCGCRLYLRDLGAGTTTALDRATGASGAIANAEVQYFAIAAGGCRVAFASRADNLVAEAAPDPGEEPTEIYVRQLAPCRAEAAKPVAGGGSAAPTGGAKGAGTGATKVAAGRLSHKALWLVFDGPGRARLRVQKAVGGRRHGWHLVKAMLVSVGTAGTVKVPLPALAPGRYRLKFRLQGDPDNPTLTRRLTVR